MFRLFYGFPFCKKKTVGKRFFRRSESVLQAQKKSVPERERFFFRTTKEWKRRNFALSPEIRRSPMRAAVF